MTKFTGFCLLLGGLIVGFLGGNANMYYSRVKPLEERVAAQAGKLAMNDRGLQTVEVGRQNYQFRSFFYWDERAKLGHNYVCGEYHTWPSAAIGFETSSYREPIVWALFDKDNVYVGQ